MKRNIVAIALLIAALCGWMFYDRYVRLALEGDVPAIAARAGVMWGVLGLIALVLAVVAGRKA